MSAFDHLLDLLPAGVILTDVTDPKGKPVLNVKSTHWQAAVALSGDGAHDAETILDQAWTQQARWDHHVRMEALNARHQDEIRQLVAQYQTDRDTRVDTALVSHRARKAKNE